MNEITVRQTSAYASSVEALLQGDIDGVEWDENDDGRAEPLAFVAFRLGVLPESFNQWGMRNGSGSTIAHIHAESKELPASFNQWSDEDGDGMTVAGIAAKYNTLPPGFKEWHLKVSHASSKCIAEQCAQNNTLPDNFNQWSLYPETLSVKLKDPADAERYLEDHDLMERTHKGYLVEHYIQPGKLHLIPKDFDWDLEIGYEETVGDRAVSILNMAIWSGGNVDYRTLSRITNTDGDNCLTCNISRTNSSLKEDMYLIPNSVGVPFIIDAMRDDSDLAMTLDLSGIGRYRFTYRGDVKSYKGLQPGETYTVKEAIKTVVKPVVIKNVGFPLYIIVRTTYNIKYRFKF